MAKKKFNKEERLAIIRKLKNIAEERTDASWEKHRTAYKPSEKYLKVKELIEQRNNACEELRKLDKEAFKNWGCDSIGLQYHLNQIRDNEIRPLIEEYIVNEIDLEVEIILMDQDKSIEDLIENLLKTCLRK